MLAQLLAFLHLLVVSPAEGAALASTAPAYLDAERGADHLRWARVAGAAHDLDPDLLLAIAWHESRYSPGEVTRESRHRVSCGVMTPVPHAAACSAWELSVPGGYWEGARHLRTWLDICRGRDRLHDSRYVRCAVLAYAGGGWLVGKCARDRAAEIRPGTDACALETLHRARARVIAAAQRRAARQVAAAEAHPSVRGSHVAMARLTHNVSISDLINLAQRVATEELIGDRGAVDATPANLAELARLVRLTLLGQVELGLWRTAGIESDEGAKLAPVVVRAELGRRLLGEAPIRITYDFSRTALPLLVVRSANAQTVT